MKKKTLVAAAIAAVFGVTGAAQASIDFGVDIDGGGNSFVTIPFLDWLPGNALAVDAVSIGAPGETFQLLYAANLNQGIGVTPTWTVTMGFTERVDTVVGSTATFSTVAGGSNYLNIYAGGATGDNLLGTGFDDGALILSATVSGGTSNFNVTNPNGPYPALDNANDNDYPGVTTLTGDGGGNVTALVNTWDEDYFDFNGMVGDIFLTTAFNFSLITPFSQIDPSQQVINDLTNVYAVPDRGAGDLNGVSNADGSKADFQFQADANQSFFVVPTPAPLALLGLGLTGLGLARRRKLA